MSIASARYASYHEPPAGGGGGGPTIGVAAGPPNELVDPESLYTKQGLIGGFAFLRAGDLKREEEGVLFSCCWVRC